MRLIMTFILLFCTILSANIYDEYELSQDANKSKNYFFTNDFDEIIRFDAIVFKNNNFTSSGAEILKKIKAEVDLLKDGKRDFFISVIGHTQPTTDDKNEKSIDSSTYANKIQNMFRDSLDINQSEELSQNYAKEIGKHLVDKGIDKNIIAVEYRMGFDSEYSDESQDARNLSNRVMVSLYIEENLDLDDDGVLNIKDYCPNTKKGIVVDVKGCKFKTIVLLADNDKNKNAITVSTKQKTITIDSVKDYTFIKTENDRPIVQKSMSDTKMKAIFTDVMQSSDVTKFTLYFNSRDFVNEDEKLVEIIKFLAQKEDAYIQIIGHTDSKGSETYNEELAKKRAQRVAKKIKESGAKYLHIQVESFGEYNLAIKTANGVSEPKNRRVEILIR